MSARLTRKIVAITIICMLIGFVIGWMITYLFADVVPRVEYDKVVAELNQKIEELERLRGPYLNYMGYTPNLKMPPSNYTGTLRVYTWSGYDEPLFYDQGDYAFSKVYPNVNIQWLFFKDLDEAFAKMMLNPTYADIIWMSDSSPLRWKESNLIEPINLSLIPLFDELYPQIIRLKSLWIGAECYYIPFEFGYTTIIYREDILNELGIPIGDRNTVDMIFRSYGGKLQSKVWLYDSAVEVFPIAARAAGVPEENIWNMSSEELKIVKDKLLQGKPNVEHYWTGWEEGYQALITGDAAIVLGWQDTYLWAKKGPDGEYGTEDDVPVVFMWPKEGIQTWTDGWSIRAGLKEQDPNLWKVAHAFINSWLDRKAGANHILYWAYGSTNKYAVEIAREEFPEVVQEFHLDDPDFALGGHIYRYIPNREQWIRIWLEVKS